ncbi:hypothetical protein CF336_g5883 [Tilletia laevis]|nr:hypothetical protein CF336_g5883 [Tilletia laevis]
MFLPRALFLLPHLFLLLAAAVNSAPVSETNCPSCLNSPRPRALEARSENPLAHLYELGNKLTEEMDWYMAQMEQIKNGRNVEDLGPHDKEFVEALLAEFHRVRIERLRVMAEILRL